jgi:hypothetical protein
MFFVVVKYKKHVHLASNLPIMETTIALKWAEKAGEDLAVFRATKADFSDLVISPWLRRKVRSHFGKTEHLEAHTICALGARFTIFRGTPDAVLQTYLKASVLSDKQNAQVTAVFDSMQAALYAFALKHNDQWAKFADKRKRNRAPSGELTTEAVAVQVNASDRGHVLYLPAGELEGVSFDTLRVARQINVAYMTDRHGVDMTLGAIAKALTEWGATQKHDPAMMHSAIHSIQGRLNRQGIPAVTRAVYTQDIIEECVKSIRSSATRGAVINCLNIVCIFANK